MNKEINIEKLLLKEGYFNPQDKSFIINKEPSNRLINAFMMRSYAIMTECRCLANIGDTFPRQCSVTGAGILSGYVFNDGDFYASTEECADIIARQVYGFDNYKKMRTALIAKEVDSPPYATQWAIEDAEAEDIVICIDEYGTCVNQLQHIAKKEPFPNGFESWQEVHYDVVKDLIENIDNEHHMAFTHNKNFGMGGMYDLAKELTNRFEAENANVNWGEEKEYYETLEQFLHIENITYI